MNRIFITGLGVISPIGIGKTAFWNSLVTGRSGAGKIFCPETYQTECQIAAEVKDFRVEDYVEAGKAKQLDRFTQFAVAAAELASQDSGIDFLKEDPTRCGVIVGSAIGGLQSLEDGLYQFFSKGPRYALPDLFSKWIANVASGEIAVRYGLEGPCYTVVSACASSNHAIGDALRHLRYGDMDVVIAGGAEAAVTRWGLLGFVQARSLATSYNDRPEKASRPFDRDREGFLIGEGAGMMIFESEKHAKKRGARVYAELSGYGATHDAYHITAPNPDGRSIARSMSLALEDAHLSEDEVQYINAHGTSTPLNDKIETVAIKNIFNSRSKKIPISSTKSMTGHLLGASGAVELIATLLTMEHQVIPPTINYETPDDECDLDYVPNVARDGEVSCAISNSFGFGGHNAVLALKKV
jgi:3-oxoacyl-[acyl-carrier-protein] synthase II